MSRLLDPQLEANILMNGKTVSRSGSGRVSSRRLGFVIAAAKTQSSATAHAAVSRPGSTNPPGKKAEEQFKNIQVLKGIPAEQLIPTMQFIAASLGVECEFCHVQGAFEKDDKKPKQTARKMMEMMFAINKDNFEGHRAVTCNSCHRGNAMPQAIPRGHDGGTQRSDGRAEGGGSERERRTSCQTNCSTNMCRLRAERRRSTRLPARVMKGTIDFGGKSLPIDIYSKDPDKRISFTHMPEGDSVTAFDGHDGWLGRPGVRAARRCMEANWTRRRWMRTCTWPRI